MYKKIQFYQNVSSSKVDLSIHSNPNQNLCKLFYGYRQIDSKVYGKAEDQEKINTTLKENKFGELMLPYFKTYYKITIIKTM